MGGGNEILVFMTTFQTAWMFRQWFVTGTWISNTGKRIGRLRDETGHTARTRVTNHTRDCLSSFFMTGGLNMVVPQIWQLK